MTSVRRKPKKLKYTSSKIQAETILPSNPQKHHPLTLIYWSSLSKGCWQVCKKTLVIFKWIWAATRKLKKWFNSSLLKMSRNGLNWRKSKMWKWRGCKKNRIGFWLSNRKYRELKKRRDRKLKKLDWRIWKRLKRIKLKLTKRQRRPELKKKKRLRLWRNQFWKRKMIKNWKKKRRQKS